MKEPNPADQAAGSGDGRKLRSKLFLLETGRTAPSFRPTESPSPTSLAVADSALRRWMAIAMALEPVIGRSALSVLYRSCLASAGAGRTWLPGADATTPPENDWPALHAWLISQTAEDALAACRSLDDAFANLLHALLGRSLTERLLRPVPALPLNGRAEQDTLG